MNISPPHHAVRGLIRFQTRFHRLVPVPGAGSPRVAHPFATLGHCCPAVRLACLIHAASVHSEPGSNSPLQKRDLILYLILVLTTFPKKERGSLLCCVLSRHITLLGFQRARAPKRARLINVHPFSVFASPFPEKSVFSMGRTGRMAREMRRAWGHGHPCPCPAFAARQRPRMQPHDGGIWERDRRDACAPNVRPLTGGFGRGTGGTPVLPTSVQ